MAHQPPRDLLSYLGTVIWGDLGPLTMYRNKKGKMVAFAKTWPDKPASALQQAQRDLFTAAAAAWQALPAPSRAQWELATHRASLCMAGYALFVHHQLKGDDQALRAVERQTQTTLLPP